jgi:transcriptional regulator with PAS, ATPase and Fis domain
MSHFENHFKISFSSGKFRGGIFCWLNLVSIGLPPLRERQNDIPLLTEYLVKKLSNIYDDVVIR